MLDFDIVFSTAVISWIVCIGSQTKGSNHGEDGEHVSVIKI